MSTHKNATPGTVLSLYCSISSPSRLYIFPGALISRNTGRKLLSVASRPRNWISISLLIAHQIYLSISLGVCVYLVYCVVDFLSIPDCIKWLCKRSLQKWSHLFHNYYQPRLPMLVRCWLYWSYLWGKIYFVTTSFDVDLPWKSLF